MRRWFAVISCSLVWRRSCEAKGVRRTRCVVLPLHASRFASLGVFFLNISSMRWVTRKPPNTLTAAKRHGRKRRGSRRSRSAPALRRDMAPTMMTGKWRWSPTSAACAAPASRSRSRDSRRRPPARTRSRLMMVGSSVRSCFPHRQCDSFRLTITIDHESRITA